jgi:hypothetical protein
MGCSRRTAPGKRIKAEEVNSQRWYDVRKVWTERVVAEDLFEPLKQQSADQNHPGRAIVTHQPPSREGAINYHNYPTNR